MTQEDKELLLKDLCARLPYGVKIHYTKHPNSSVDEDTDDTVQGYYSNLVVGGNTDYCLDRCKPYLRPMSSMTEEEEEQWLWLTNDSGWGITEIMIKECVDFLNKKMFDYRGLIEKGLAKSTEVFNPYK